MNHRLPRRTIKDEMTDSIRVLTPSFTHSGDYSYWKARIEEKTTWDEIFGNMGAKTCKKHNGRETPDKKEGN